MYEIQFKKLNEQTLDEFRQLVESCPYNSTAFCPGQRFMWRKSYPTEFTVLKGYLVVRIKHQSGFEYLFPYPVNKVAGEIADLNEILDCLDEHMENTDSLLVFSALDDEQVRILSDRYTNYKVVSKRHWADYLYLTEDLAAFAGRRYSGQRNHIKHFKTDYPNAVFRPLVLSDREKLEAFFDEFESNFTKTSEMAKDELFYAKEHMLLQCKDCIAYCVELDNRIIAICLGEKFGDCIDVQIEKCLPGYRGCYPFVVNEFAKANLGKSKYLNREDDAGDMGLRTSKLQYRPLMLIPNRSFTVTNELFGLSIDSSDSDSALASAQIEDSVLTLTALFESDSSEYDKLCKDTEHNRLWEYYPQKPDVVTRPSGYFLKSARTAFEKGTALSLAIRLDGRFIGEAVFFVFNGRGGCKLGWRLLPEYCGKGYGAAAFKLAGDYALTTIGLSKVTAYCHKENEASARAIAHSMTQTGEDDKFIYFERNI